MSLLNLLCEYCVCDIRDTKRGRVEYQYDLILWRLMLNIYVTNDKIIVMVYDLYRKDRPDGQIGDNWSASDYMVHQFGIHQKIKRKEWSRNQTTNEQIFNLICVITDLYKTSIGIKSNKTTKSGGLSSIFPDHGIAWNLYIKYIMLIQQRWRHRRNIRNMLLDQHLIKDLVPLITDY
jgi:hypothetical protein